MPMRDCLDYYLLEEGPAHSGWHHSPCRWFWVISKSQLSISKWARGKTSKKNASMDSDMTICSSSYLDFFSDGLCHQSISQSNPFYPKLLLVRLCFSIIATKWNEDNSYQKTLLFSSVDFAHNFILLHYTLISSGILESVYSNAIRNSLRFWVYTESLTSAHYEQTLSYILHELALQHGLMYWEMSFCHGFILIICLIIYILIIYEVKMLIWYDIIMIK